MSISKLQITNFQKHENLRVDFDPKITAIVGPSDTGKSAIIRALRWVISNRPLGEQFIRWGSKKAEVKARINEKTIRRRRGGGENVYELGDKKFEAFGNNVPPEIGKSINLADANIQLQHEFPFWMSLSSWEFAKELNKITNLEIIDEVTSKIASIIRQLNAEKDVVQQRLEVQKEKKDSLKFVVIVDRELKALEDLQTAFSEKQEKIDNLSKLLDNLYLLNRGIITKRSKKLQLDGIIEQGEKVISLRKKYNQLRDLVDCIEELAKKANKKAPDISKLEELKSAWVVLKEKIVKLIDEIREAKAGESCHTRLVAELKKSKETFERESGGVCPLCGNSLT